MALAVPIKRGSTFVMKATYTPAGSDLPSLEGAVLTSQVRKGRFVQTLDVALAPDGLTFTVDGGDTTTWPLGLIDWDVRIDLDGSVIYTDTVQLNLVRNVSEPPP